MTKNIFILPVISGIVMLWPGIAADQNTVSPVASAAAKAPAVLYEQKFDWDDALDSGQYVWGQDGFLKMDGSQGKIQCSHRLKNSITDGASQLTLSAIVVLGKSYRIILYDSLHEPVATVDIQRDGRVIFGANSSREVDSGANIACSPGKPCGSAGREQSMARATSLQVIEFSDFNFKSGTFNFSINEQKYSNIPLRGSSSNISFVEIQTLSVEPGSIIWLESFRQERDQHKIVEDEQFTSYWTSNATVTPGYPADKWQATSYRPKDYKWLEMTTHYGAVYVKFSDTPIASGSVEMEVMTDNIEHEVQVNLGEYKYDPVGTFGYLPADSTGISTISGGWNADLGIFAGVWTPFQDKVENAYPTLLRPSGTFKAFDDAPSTHADQPVRLKIAWDVSTQKYRVWIDGISQRYNGSAELPMMLMPRRGIDMIMIHAGDINPWRGPLLRVSWGDIRMTRD